MEVHMARDSKKKTTATADSKLSKEEQFILMAISKLSGTKYTVKDKKTGNAVEVTRDGVHVVFDGINNVLQHKFGMADKQARIDFINGMADRDLIDVRQVKGGARIWLAGKMPPARDYESGADRANKLYSAVVGK
jgi:hypothetical protein